MPVLFFDTSALVKRYGRETGSAWVTQLLAPDAGYQVHLSRLTGTEVVAALTRRGRGGAIRPEDAEAAVEQFLQEFQQQFFIVEADPILLAHSIQLARHHGLRGYDAVQLASSLHVNAVGLAVGLPPLTLVSADHELNAAAQAEGLTVENPNDHP